MSHSTDQIAEQPEFSRMIQAGLSRRTFLSLASAGTAAAFLGMPSRAMELPGDVSSSLQLLGFQQVPASTADMVQVPRGYTAEPLISWGDPIFPHAPEFDQSANAQVQSLQFGDNNDGMHFFPLDEDRAVLVVNNEYTNYEYLFPHQGKPQSLAEVRKAQAAHGISVVELTRKGGTWQVDQSGKLNRRITANTPMEISGPAAGHSLMATAADPSGRHALGTFNNCANGQTPWGTYLTCEENFHGYFGSLEEIELDENYAAYGIERDATWAHPWYEYDQRFDLARNPHEPHRHGWVVEIDPRQPYTTPQKRTALGRFKHENAELVVNHDRRVVVYLGDDERGEHIYKFVSRGKYDSENPTANRNLLEEGTLYVAKFEGKEGELEGTGRWIDLTWGKHGLTPENGFADPAEVLIFARKAAKQVGATTMDRPEWVAVHPDSKHVYCTLTNNKNRGMVKDQPIDSANPRPENKFGHVIRWQAPDGDHTAERFDWELYLLAGNPLVHADDAYRGSENINRQNMFNSPDGLAFDKAGRLWILTDGDYSNEGDFAGIGNNQMLCSDTRTGEVRRFLTGPVACEITGVTFAPDYKTMFVGVQHPGEEVPGTSHFPGGGDSIPRSTVMMISKDDGGVIGE